MKKYYFFLVVLAACSSLHAQVDVPNKGLEDWALDQDSVFNPASWSTSNDMTDTAVLRYSPAYAGNYSMLVRAIDPGFVIPGIAYTDFPLNFRPTHFRA